MEEGNQLGVTDISTALTIICPKGAAKQIMRMCGILMVKGERRTWNPIPKSVLSFTFFRVCPY